MIVKIVSYNIHKGFNLGNSKMILSEAKLALQKINPDIVLLQEVVGDHNKQQFKIPDWETSTQFEYLADQLWPHYTYGKNAIYSSGHHGNAILSKFPFINYENIDISTNRFEKRGLLHGTVEVANLAGKKKVLHLICLHLNLMESGRKKQMLHLSSAIRQRIPDREALIVGGDFNDWTQKANDYLTGDLYLHEAFDQLWGEHAKTFPSFFPVLRLDRLYSRGLFPTQAKILKDSPWNKLSDHLALLVEFEFPEI